MTIDVTPFRVREGEKPKLRHRPTRVASIGNPKEEYETLLARQVGELDRLQQRLYAAGSHALLLIFQAMDAGGKDGAIRHVMSGVNPQGCQVVGYKQPSHLELRHDFLWRCVRDLPERGRIGIFNRSYYEEVLVARVHPDLLRAEGLPEVPRKLGRLWKHRYRSINDLEKHLTANGTTVVKFFLHISKEEQRKRLLGRIDEAEKNWKFDAGDVRERAFWDDYMEAYEDCIAATSTDEAPWCVVPADDKRSARLIVSQAILDAMASLKLRFPKTNAAHRAELEAARAELMRERE